MATKKEIEKKCEEDMKLEKITKVWEKAFKVYREADRKTSEAKEALIKTINEVIDTWREYREADDAYFEATKKG